MQLWKFFTVSLFRSARLAMHQTTTIKKASGCNEEKSSAIKQGGCRVRQQWELGVRFWLFGPYWSSG